jgi:hypothetical protein
MVGNIFLNIWYVSENANHLDIMICVNFEKFYNFSKVPQEVLPTSIGSMINILN